jgi:hypothetical protein
MELLETNAFRPGRDEKKNVAYPIFRLPCASGLRIMSPDRTHGAGGRKKEREE